MNEFSAQEVTQLLLAWGDGDKGALNRLMPLVYDELKRMAARQLRHQKPGHTLQTTALVNEAYCKMIDQKNVRWQNRAHFFAMASHLMRQILIDHARRHLRIKRGGSARKISLDETTFIPEERAAELVALDDALHQLAEFDEQKSRIVEMKFFGGLNTEEIAEVEHVSTRTIERQWRKAKAWLYDAIQQ